MDWYIPRYRRSFYILCVLIGVFLIPALLSTETSYESKITFIGIYGATVMALYIVGRVNTNEFQRMRDLMSKNDAGAIAGASFSIDTLRYLKRLYIFLAEGDLVRALELVKSFGFKYYVCWTRTNIRFKESLRVLREALSLCGGKSDIL